MNKLFKENGFLSEEGERVFKEILDGKIATLLKQGTSENEIRIIGGLIQKRVGDAVADAVQVRREIVSKYAAMTDKQFQAYLVAKYGDNWMFQSLTPDELDRCPKLQSQEIENILKESAKHVTKFPRNGIRFK
jgi:hypothetical protein